MGTLKQAVDRVAATISPIAAAIIAKGGTVAVGDGLEEFAADIATIPSGGAGHTVNITTVPNATVTLSKTGKTYTDTADNTGHVSFNAVEVGTYTVTATIDDAESDSTTLTVTDFSATEDSFATLTVSASEDTTVTFTDGIVAKTHSYTTTGSPIVQRVSLGTWDVSAVIEGTTMVRTLSVSSYSNQNINFAPTPPYTEVSMSADFTQSTRADAYTLPSAADLAASSVYSNIGRCNVADDGTINAYYGDVSYKEDGSNGQVMVKIPKFYYKLTTSATSGTAIDSGTWSISDQQVDNTYELHPAFLDANGNEIDYFLVGAFDGVAYDGTSYTTTGNASYKLSSVASATVKPVNNFTRATGRTMGTNRGTGWYQLGFKQIQALTMLFGVEFGFNSQVAVGMGNVGTSATLYPGVTTGNTTSGDTSGQSTAVNWRGIENLWGNIWNWIDGLNIISYVPYFCKNYSFVDDVTSTQDANYEQIGFSVPTSSGTFPTRFGYDVNHSWVILPIATSSTENAGGPIGDKYWVTSGSRVADLGGYWSNGTNAGLCYWDLSSGSSRASASVGSRPMFIP